MTALGLGCPSRRAIAAYFRAGFALMSAYRGEIMLWAIATALPLIMMGVWVPAADSGRFEGITGAETARYFIAALVIRQFTVCWVIFEFEWQVISGRLSSRLLHPIDPLWWFVLIHLGEQLVRLPFVLLLVGLGLWIYPQALWGDGATVGGWAVPWLGLPVLMLMVYAAFAIRFLLQYTTAMLAFWVERVQAFDSLNFIPYMFLSGMMIPLHVLPAEVLSVVLWTPFPYMLWMPAQFLAGAEVNLVQGFFVITAWITGLLLLNRMCWRLGLKHYSAMGA